MVRKHRRGAPFRANAEPVFVPGCLLTPLRTLSPCKVKVVWLASERASHANSDSKDGRAMGDADDRRFPEAHERRGEKSPNECVLLLPPSPGRCRREPSGMCTTYNVGICRRSQSSLRAPAPACSSRSGLDLQHKWTEYLGFLSI